MGFWNSVRDSIYSVGDGVTNAVEGVGDIVASPVDGNLLKGIKKVGKGVVQVLDPVVRTVGAVMPSRAPGSSVTPTNDQKPEEKPKSNRGYTDGRPPIVDSRGRVIASGGSGQMGLPTINDDDKMPPIRTGGAVPPNIASGGAAVRSIPADLPDTTDYSKAPPKGGTPVGSPQPPQAYSLAPQIKTIRNANEDLYGKSIFSRKRGKGSLANIGNPYEKYK